ncbi:reverse transcriptase domain-containing protein [Tanacetum coccineum]|uniref:Reverse transcriptase domain-containing protein n=1 Tax=Tanacetum coccineum TaxID=301880 RepID=A0ABQ5BYF4_9ASTR
MRTRSSFNLVGNSSSNPTTTNPKHRNCRRSKQPFSLEELPIATMADQRTMAELLRAPTEGYAEAIVVPPILAEHFELKHSLINMMTSDKFFDLEERLKSSLTHPWFIKITSTYYIYKDVPNSTIKLMLFPFSLARAARRWLEKEPPRSILTWEDLMSKIINEFFPPQNGQISEKNFPTLKHVLEYRFMRHGIVTMISFRVALTLCLAADGNTFPEYRDNIQGYVAVAAGNYNQGNSGYRPPGVVNQTRPPGLAQPNVQNNQNRFSQPQGYNRGNNFNQNATYQAPIQQNQSVPLNKLEKIKKMNDVNIKAMQAQINNVKNKLRNEMQTSIQTSMSNQTNELKNMMASFFQMNTASTSGMGSLPRNTIANPKGELKAITTRSSLVLDGPSIPMPPPFINPEEDERVEDTLTDQEHDEFTIKVPPSLVQKAKPPSQRNFVVHQRDPRHPHIPYPLRMNQEKQKEKDEVQIHKFWQMFKQLHINISLADALILIPKYQKMLKSLLSNKEKLLELANTPLNKNCSAVILKKLPEKLGDPGKFLIPCGFSELKCKALADLGASINLMPLSVWKKLGLLELISTQMTLKLANREICTPVGIARDAFILVGKFTSPADFLIVDYKSDPRVPLILERPFLRTARALIDVHEEEMILRDGNERLTLNMRHDTSSYSTQPHQESINMIDVYNVSHEKYREDLFVTNHQSGNPTFSSHTDLTSPEVINQLSGNPTPISKPVTKSSSSSPTLTSIEESDLIWEEFEAYLASDSFPPGNSNPSSPLPPFHNSLSGITNSSSPSLSISETSDYFLEEFADELALIIFPPGNDDLPFDAESDLRELEYLLNHDPIKEMESILEDSVNKNSPDDNLVDTLFEMFTNGHALDYSSPPLWDDYDGELFDLETVNDNTYDDPFDFKEEKIKDSKILIDELDPPRLSDFLPSPECDLVFYKDFSWMSRIFEASRALGFVLRSLELHILSFILGIQYLNLID